LIEENDKKKKKKKARKRRKEKKKKKRRRRRRKRKKKISNPIHPIYFSFVFLSLLFHSLSVLHCFLLLPLQIEKVK
jgi:hypothetical protein